jgi:hypothetical protein
MTFCIRLLGVKIQGNQAEELGCMTVENRGTSPTKQGISRAHSTQGAGRAEKRWRTKALLWVSESCRPTAAPALRHHGLNHSKPAISGLLSFPLHHEYMGVPGTLSRGIRHSLGTVRFKIMCCSGYGGGLFPLSECAVPCGNCAFLMKYSILPWAQAAQPQLASTGCAPNEWRLSLSESYQ